MTKHPFSPIYDKNSTILILGSFPSVKSREEMCFYGHPQNRFWKVISTVFSAKVPNTIEEKKRFLAENKIALWDVLALCEIKGSADSSIKNESPNDLSKILAESCVKRIFTNGKTAEKYYNKYHKDKLEIKSTCLPSTSPANAAWTLERLVSAWKITNPQSR